MMFQLYAHAPMRLLLSALLCAGALSAPVCAQSEVQESQTTRTWHAEIDALAPDFDLKDSVGKSWKLSDHRGQVVVLEWFNPQCPVVTRAHSAGGTLEKLGNESAKTGVAWVAINSGAPGTPGSGVNANVEGARKLEMNYPVLLDETGWVGRMYGATNTPNMYIVDRRGNLVYTGGHQDELGANLIAEALTELNENGKIAVPRTKSFGCSVKYARQVEVGLVAPDLWLECLRGEEHRLSALRGNYVVLEWFNPACPVVAEAHSPGGSLDGLAKRLGARDVRWLGINSGAPGKPGTSVEEMQRAVNSWGIDHPILLDASGKIGKAYGAYTTPELFVIDRRGVIIYAGAPAPIDEPSRSYIQQALEDSWAGRAVATPKTKPYGCGIKYEF